MKTSHGWFEVERFPHGITMIAEPGHYEDVKSYLVEGERDVAVLDTGMGVGDFAGLVAELSDRKPIVLHSHAHFDHIGASHQYERVLVHPSEADDLREGYSEEKFRPWFAANFLVGNRLPADFDVEHASIPGCEPTGELNHGDRIDLGGRVLEVFLTPGHSPGGITLLDRANRALFPGDAVYAGPMFAYRPYSDPMRYRETLELLAKLCDLVDVVYPSHNAVPLTPDDVRAMQRAYEEIWAGRPADRKDSEKHVFEFENFSFWLRPGDYGEAAPIQVTVDELLTRITDSRRALLNYVASLDSRQATELRDRAGWSVKDHLAHLIRWQRSILFLLQGKTRHDGLGVDEDAYSKLAENHDYDAFNGRLQARDRDVPLAEVLRGLEAIHAETVGTLTGMTDADLMRPYASYVADGSADDMTDPVVFWIVGNTTFHYNDHLQWMQELVDSES